MGELMLGSTPKIYGEYKKILSGGTNSMDRAENNGDTWRISSGSRRWQ